MSAAIDHVYRYRAPSSLAPGDRPRLVLATSGGAAAHPRFFQGEIASPRALGQLLRGLSRIVGARFYTPPGMLARILREADPVVTCGSGMLRFEGFSACASAHARVDLDPSSYDGEVVSSGTTNVDFNAPMRAALASLRDGDRVSIAVGPGEVELEANGATVVERRVPLPVRWLRSFVEVQAYQSRMTPRLETSGVEAVRFLRSLPRASTARHTAFIVASGRSLRVAGVATRGAIQASGLERLRVLEDLAPLARRLVVHADDAGQGTAWELELPGMRFTLTLSAGVARGFSGEGQALTILASERQALAVSRVRAALRWQARVDVRELAGQLGVEHDEVTRALVVLGARGLVGYDAGQASYFHRELPYDLDAVEALQPRLTAAREVVAAGRVRLRDGATTARVEADVEGSGVVHRVVLEDAGSRCSCAWYAKHQGSRGPCKHVLATQLAMSPEES